MLPWKHWMGFGLGVLRIPPAQFWSMTPKELNAAFAGLYGSPHLSVPPARSDLVTLMQNWPDTHIDRKSSGV